MVELALRREFDLRGLEAALTLFGGFGAAADESANEFVPARRREEDEERIGGVLLDLTRALQVDLEQREAAVGDGLLHGRLRRAVRRPTVDDGVLEETTVRGHLGELVVRHEVVVDTVHLTRTWRARRR